MAAGGLRLEARVVHSFCNCSDHVRKGEVQLVTQWHVDTLKSLGCKVESWHFVHTPRMGFGENRAARVEYESVVVMRKV